MSTEASMDGQCTDVTW